MALKQLCKRTFSIVVFRVTCIFQFLFLKVPKRAVFEISFSESISTLENEGSYLRVMFFKLFCLLPFFLLCHETLSQNFSAEDLKDSLCGWESSVHIYLTGIFEVKSL